MLLTRALAKFSCQSGNFLRRATDDASIRLGSAGSSVDSLWAQYSRSAPSSSLKTLLVACTATAQSLRHARYMHTTGKPVWTPPEVVLVKLGADGYYMDWKIKWAKLKSLRVGGLLQDLSSSKLFGGALNGVPLSGCRVYILKGSAAADCKDKAVDGAMQLEAATTVGAAALAACTGCELRIDVLLPATAPSIAVPSPGGTAHQELKVAADVTAAELMAALPFARLEAVDGHGEDGCQVLVLYNARGEPVNWPKLSSNKVLIRPVFREFFERQDMLNRCSRRGPDSGDSDSLVLGVPGEELVWLVLPLAAGCGGEAARRVRLSERLGAGQRDRDGHRRCRRLCVHR